MYQRCLEVNVSNAFVWFEVILNLAIPQIGSIRSVTTPPQFQQDNLDFSSLRKYSEEALKFAMQTDANGNYAS